MKMKVFFTYFLCRSSRGVAYTFFPSKKVYKKIVARNLCIMGRCKGKFVQMQGSKATLAVKEGGVQWAAYRSPFQWRQDSKNAWG